MVEHGPAYCRLGLEKHRMENQAFYTHRHSLENRPAFITQFLSDTGPRALRH